MDFLAIVEQLVRDRASELTIALAELAAELGADERATVLAAHPDVGQMLAFVGGLGRRVPSLDDTTRRRLRAAWEAIPREDRARHLAMAFAIVARHNDDLREAARPTPPFVGGGAGGGGGYYPPPDDRPGGMPSMPVPMPMPMPQMGAPRPRDTGQVAAARPPRGEAGWLVNLGIAKRATPGEPFDDPPLRRRRTYLLWVELAQELLVGSLTHPDVPPLPPVPSGGEITVVVAPFSGHLKVLGRRVGRIRLAEGEAHVTAAAATPPRAPDDLRARRLFFELRTPWRHGRYLVRVSLYFRGLLLQSHVVAAWVGPAPALERTLDSTLDYALSHSLDLARLDTVPEHQLSILLNDDGEGTHGLRFVGASEWARDAELDDVQLNGLIEYARGGLREVAWANRKPFEADKCTYRYEPPDPALLEPDLILLARHGYRLYAETTKALGIAGRKARPLAELMRAPGHVQVALRRGAAHLYPASLVYDHPLDSSARNLRVCDAFRAALAARHPLADEPCFRGACPSYGDMKVVCPAGFWGYRHRIGVPISLDEGEVATTVHAGGPIEVLVALSTDPAFTRRARHVATIQAMRATTILAEDRDAALAALARRLHVAYFYCHGGITSAGVPYLEVGPRGSEPIVGDNLLAYGIEWDDPRPLVILNGCHTTAAKPEQLMDLVGSFVNHARAAGVFGTEITVFEPLAVAFGEELLGNLLGGVAAGESVRRARLALLAAGNPLGLAYIPFVLPSIAIT